MLQILKDAFISFDRQFKRHRLEQEYLDESGAAAVVAVKIAQRLYVANAGYINEQEMFILECHINDAPICSTILQNRLTTFPVRI